MFCSKCGKEIMSEAVVCPGCGCPVKKPFSPAWGYIMGFLFPIIGIILSFVYLAKGSPGHFAGVLATSICSWFFWIGVIEQMGGM